MNILNKIYNKIDEGLKERQRKSNLRSQGKVIFESNKELPEDCDTIIKEGYYQAQRKEQQRLNAIEKQKRDIEKMKMQQKLDIEKLKSAKLKNQISKEKNKGKPKSESNEDYGWLGCFLKF